MLRLHVQAMEREFKAVTDEEKKGVVGLGGLHVIGTERHEARRVDNQLRGRSGRCVRFAPFSYCRALTTSCPLS